MKFTIYKTRTRQWRWRLRARNGEILASGESYRRRKDCFKAVYLVRSTDVTTPMEFPKY